jgi:hypothetical protein
MQYHTHLTDPTPLVQRTKMQQPVVRICSEVVLGSPSSNCNGVGICRVMVAGKISPAVTCPSVSTWLNKSPEGGLQMHFPKQQLNEKQRRRHFAWHLFTVMEPYRLSPRLCKALGITDPWIRPGIYQVFESHDLFTVSFTGNLAAPST